MKPKEKLSSQNKIKSGENRKECKPGESMAESGEHALFPVSFKVWVAIVLLIPSNSHEYTVLLLGPTSLITCTHGDECLFIGTFTCLLARGQQ